MDRSSKKKKKSVGNAEAGINMRSTGTAGVMIFVSRAKHRFSARLEPHVRLRVSHAAAQKLVWSVIDNWRYDCMLIGVYHDKQTQRWKQNNA